AQAIAAYREARIGDPLLFNSRLDYERLLMLASHDTGAIVFTELQEYHRVGGRHVIVTIGSLQQPFQLFVPDADSDAGQAILHLFDNRYIADEPEHPRRSYAYVHGTLKLFAGKPEIVVRAPEQISDDPPS
ncbi:MAG: thermonuclease family protein, partial [Gammaproteobacteria bacterium]